MQMFLAKYVKVFLKIIHDNKNYDVAKLQKNHQCFVWDNHWFVRNFASLRLFGNFAIQKLTNLNRIKMDKKKTIEALQFFVTGLTEGALVHKLQGQLFKSQGFGKLGDKYVGHFSEEMGWVEKFVDRILDLGCDVKFDGAKARDLIADPIDYIKADLAIQEKGVELLYKCMAELHDDPTTYDILKAYLADEEEDLYWSQGQLELIEKIGVQNWLIKQL